MNLKLKSVTPLFLVFVVMISCKTNKEDLIGFWRLESASSNNEELTICAAGEKKYHVQFQEDGVLNHSYSEVSGSYKISDDSIYISTEGDKKSWHFLVDQDLLTMTCKTSNGETMVQTYSRQFDYKFE